MFNSLILPDGPVIKQRVLNRQEVGTYGVISRYVFQNANYNVIEDELTGLMVRLVSEVLTEHIVSETQTAELDVPASWWQHFKQDHRDRWFMRRFVRRWPVAYTTWQTEVRFSRYATYPNADVKMPPSPLGRPVYVESIGFGDWNSR